MRRDGPGHRRNRGSARWRGDARCGTGCACPAGRHVVGPALQDGTCERSAVLTRRFPLWAGRLDKPSRPAETPPHPASAFDRLRLGHPLPAGERRFVGRRADLSTLPGKAKLSTTSSPQRGEGGRAKRRPGEGASQPDATVHLTALPCRERVRQHRTLLHRAALLGAACLALLFASAPAQAQFTVCNQTLDVVNLAVGQEVDRGLPDRRLVDSRRQPMRQCHPR